jgi:nitrogen-specific signal transduction histidine kinase/CheY-like chemotaxis protein
MNYLLVVTEDADFASTLKKSVPEQYLIENVEPPEAIRVISARKPAVVLLDTDFKNFDSVSLLRKLIQCDSALTVVGITEPGSKTAKEFLRNGVFDVVEKPLVAEEFSHILNRAVEREKLLKENISMKERSSLRPPDCTDSRTEGNDGFFRMLFMTIAEYFPDLRKFCSEILKILREKFYFNNMVVFLLNKHGFVPYASLGIDRNIVDRLKIESGHMLIRWLLSQNRILNVYHEKEIPYEIRSFLDILNCRVIFPFKTFGGKLLGFFAVGDKFTGQRIPVSELSFLNITADYLATVFDNAFLYNEISFQKNYQETVFHNIPAGIIGVNEEGKVTMFSPYAEKILNINSREVMNEPVEKIGSQISDLLRRTLKFGEIFSRKEFRFRPTKTILGISTNCIKNAAGETEGAVAIFQDLEYIKQLEKKEREAEKGKYWTALASRLSHELKNPLVAVNAFAQMLPDKFDDEEFRTNFSRVVQEEIVRINKIVEKINKLADSLDLKTENLNVVELFKEEVKQSSAGLNVKFTGSREVNTAADPVKLKEAIGYIFDFVKEDTDDKPVVEVNFSEGEAINITVSENGKKIKFENTEDVFIPFNPEIKSMVTIGMMLSRKIIEAHQGSLDMELTPSGKKFKISL